MKYSWPALLILLAIPIGVGMLSSTLSGDVGAIFNTLPKPPLTPPSWVFPVMWTILYVLMGIASYLVFTSDGSGTAISRALSLYFFQLVFNFFWPILFFRLGQYGLSLLWIVALLGLIALTMVHFYPISPSATYLLIPYFLWVAFATYLNFAIYLSAK